MFVYVKMIEHHTEQRIICCMNWRKLGPLLFSIGSNNWGYCKKTCSLWAHKRIYFVINLKVELIASQRKDNLF